MNIDKVDHIILEELQRDARRSNKALAEAASVSAPTMLNRVRSLEERGIITGYHAEVDNESLNRRVEALISVRLSPKTPNIVEEFVDAVWELDETVSITVLTGSVDVLVHMSGPDIETLGDTVLEQIASAPNVSDERTTIILNYDRKNVLKPLDEASDPG